MNPLCAMGHHCAYGLIIIPVTDKSLQTEQLFTSSQKPRVKIMEMSLKITYKLPYERGRE